MTGDALIVILRFAFVLLLYGFLFNLVLAIRRELRVTAQREVRDEPARPAARPRPAERARARLVVVQAGQSGLEGGRAFALGDEAIIGRAAESQVRIDNRQVSAQHARLWRHNGSWYIQDLESTNGTLLNQQPVEGQQPVEYGDVVEIGGVVMKLAR